MTLRASRIRDWYTGLLRPEVIIETTDGRCDGPHDEDPAPAATLAHVGFEIVAQVLAEPIRRAWQAHWELPHAEIPGSAWPYRAYCPECARLTALLPDGDKPVVMA